MTECMEKYLCKPPGLEVSVVQFCQRHQNGPGMVHGPTQRLP